MNVFCFIWEQTATCVTYSIKWLVFYNGDEKCLVRSTDWAFKYSRLPFVFKVLFHCSTQDNKDISSFAFVNNYELGIVVIANLKGWMNFEDVTTRRVVQLEK
jgi:hypothetical protein